MIQPVRISNITSRKYCNVLNEHDTLPLMTAPMNGVCDHTNYKHYLDNKIVPVLSRSSNLDKIDIFNRDKIFISCSLQDVDKYVGAWKNICIDTANGHMASLHNKVQEIKDNTSTVVMAGNIANPISLHDFHEIRCDYVRVGIGGGNLCTSTTHTGIGQENLLTLISECAKYKKINMFKTKIIADGISSYIKQNDFHHNGYSAINHLLYYGADYVMLGSIFSKTTEASNLNMGARTTIEGMSTQNNQRTYNKVLKHSEGTSKEIRIDYTLDEWLNGSERIPNEYPGFISCLQSAMSYTNSFNLNQFRI